MMLFPDEGSPEPGARELYYEAPIGATGAIGTVVRNRGFTSVTRTGVGVYQFVIDPAIAGAGAVMDVSAQVVDSAPAIGNGIWGIVTDKTSTVGTVVVTFFNNSVVAADPRNGASIVCHITVKASTV